MNQQSNKLLDDLFAPVRSKIWKLSEFLVSDENNKNEAIVEGLIHREEFVLCSATAKSGKTFLALDLAISVASGKAFLGLFNTHKGRVLYIETELTSFFLKERISNFLTEKNDEVLENLLVCKEVIRLDQDDGKLELTKIINQYRPDLIILDPFYRLHCKNEDKSQEITPLLNLIKQLAQTYKTAFFVLHHEGKKGESSGNQLSHRPRGTSAFADVPDAIISMTREKEKNIRRLSIEQRNFQGAKIIIRLKEDLSGWEVIENDLIKENYSSSEITKFFNEGPISKDLLVKKMSETLSISHRTCERRIASAVKQGVLNRVFKSSIVYFTLKADSPICHSLGDGEWQNSMEEQ